MNDIAVGLGSDILIVFLFFLLVLAVLWFLLPFAVFGVKDRLDKLIQLQEKTNKLLELSLPDYQSENAVKSNKKDQ